jgi:predicted phosphoribosyltransferase
VEAEEVARRERLYRDARPMPEVRGRTVILVDDGLATGSTMRAAVASLRRRGAGKIVVAVPVASREAREELRAEADEVVCLATPEPFHAVGLWYDDFEQTTDDEVRALVEERPDEGAEEGWQPSRGPTSG